MVTTEEEVEVHIVETHTSTRWIRELLSMKSIIQGVVTVETIAATIRAEEADTTEEVETTPTIKPAEEMIAEDIAEEDVIIDTTKEVTMEHMDKNNVPRVY
jgi:hypothetical protein